MSVLQTIKDSAKDLNSPDPVKKARAEEIKKRYTQGLFNDELTKEGAKPVPIAPPKIDLAAAMAGVKQEPGLQSTVPTPPTTVQKVMGTGGGEGMSRIKDIPSDIAEGASSIAQDFKNRWGAVATKDTQRAQEGMNMPGRIAADTGSVVAATLGTVVDSLFEGGKTIVKATLTPTQEDAIASGFKSVVGAGMEQIKGTPIEQEAKDIVASYNHWAEAHPELAREVGDATSIAGSIADLMGLKLGRKVGEEAISVASKVIDESAPAVKKAVQTGVKATETTVGAIPSAVQKVVAKSPEAADAALTEAVKRVIQTPAKDTATQARHVAAAKDTLTRIAETGVKDLTDYKTLVEKTDMSAKGIREAKAAYLAKFPETYKPERLALGETVNGVTQGWSPVEQALDGLEQAYKSSGDVAKSLEFKQLRTKLETEGLTVSEIDDIAAKYGTEYRAKAFDKMGNVRPGFNADNFEAVRRGVKQVAREKLPDDFAKELDTQLSHDITTKELLDRMAAVAEKKINTLPQTSKLRKAVNATTNVAVGTVDLLTGKVMSNIVKAITTRAGVLQKTSLTPLELQAELKKQMKIIQKMNKIKDPKAYEKAVSKYLNEDMGIGMSIRSTVRPDLVAKKLIQNTFKDVRALIQDPSLRNEPDYASSLTNLGLNKTTDEELASFLKDVINEYEMAADIPVKN